MLRSRSWRAVAVSSGAVLALAGGTLSAQAAAVRGWRVAAAISVSGQSTVMTAVDAVSASDAWAVGVSATRSKEFAVVRHWTGKAWKQVVLPARVARKWNAELPDFVTTAASRTSLLMLSTASPGDYLLLAGKHWKLGRLPGSERLSSISGAATFGATDAWAFGTATTSSGRYQVYAGHFNGSRWTTVPVHVPAATEPPEVDFPVLSAVSADDIWGVAGSTVLRWTGTAAGFYKAAVQPPFPSGSVLTSIVAEPGGAVWVAGVKGDRVFAAAWNGTRWSLTNLPVSSRHFPILSLAANGHGGMWALGLDTANPKDPVTRLWLYSRGTWTEPPLHLGHDPLLIQLAAVPRTGTVWAVGATRDGSLYRGLIVINGPVPH
jgi:hypothetical protein